MRQPTADQFNLAITPTDHGWRVSDLAERLPPSFYDSIEEAREEAREFLRNRGGGRAVIYEGSIAVGELEV